MLLRPDHLLLFLKTSYILDMGLIFNLNYRPAKPTFTREIIRVLLADAVTCPAESQSSGRQLSQQPDSHSSFPSLQWAPCTDHNLHPKHRAVSGGKVP